MKQPLLRYLLMWLVLLALPLQGYAAARMLGCGPGHHGPVAVAAHEHAGETHRSGHQHAQHGGKAIQADKCSACAACCSVAALPTAVLDLAVERPVLCAVAGAALPRLHFHTDGPLRPPRSSLLV